MYSLVLTVFKASVTRVHAVLAAVLRLHCIVISMLGKTLRPESKFFLSVLSCCRHIQLQADNFSALQLVCGRTCASLHALRSAVF